MQAKSIKIIGLNIKPLLVFFCMIISSFWAIVLKPNITNSRQFNDASLAAMVPAQFADWKAADGEAPIMVNPEILANIEKVYAATLTRTYLNGNGDRIMLSIAYGKAQSRNLQVHRPEVCYSAQGFEVNVVKPEQIMAQHFRIKAGILVARQGGRIEPITYWFRVGDQTGFSKYDQMLARYRYGLLGKIADGVLVRISIISADAESAFKLEGQFAVDLIDALSPDNRFFFVGQESE